MIINAMWRWQSYSNGEHFYYYSLKSVLIISLYQDSLENLRSFLIFSFVGNVSVNIKPWGSWSEMQNISKSIYFVFLKVFVLM